jgi:hypothetical protein
MREILEEIRTNGESEELRAEYALYQEKRDLVRLLLGWEIDAPKHGGYYKIALEELLKFFQEPPARIDHWAKPYWMAFRKREQCERETVGVSPLDQAHFHAEAFASSLKSKTTVYLEQIAEGLERTKFSHQSMKDMIVGEDRKASGRAMRKDVMQRLQGQVDKDMMPESFTLHAEMQMVDMTQSERERATEALKKIKARYGNGMRFLMELQDAHTKIFDALSALIIARKGWKKDSDEPYPQLDPESIRPSGDTRSAYQLIVSKAHVLDDPFIGAGLPAFKAMIKRKLLRSGEMLLQIDPSPKVSKRDVAKTLDTVNQDHNAAVKSLVESCREEVELLIAAGIRPEVVGAVAYEISYLNVRVNRKVDLETGEYNVSFTGVSFPWRVCLEEVIAALVTARGDIAKATPLNAKSIKNVAFYCASADGQAVMEAIRSVREITLERARLSKDSDNYFLVGRVPNLPTPLFWVQASSESKFEWMKINKTAIIQVDAEKHSANTLALDLTVHFG